MATDAPLPGVDPESLAQPIDDGAADHLVGLEMPDLVLPSTSGDINLRDATERPTIVVVHPGIGGVDGVAMDDWIAIPGAFGCTSQVCGFDQHLDQFAASGRTVLGLSALDPARSAAAVAGLGLRVPLVSDVELRLAAAPLRLPTMPAGDARVFRRCSLLVEGSTIRSVRYPVFPPGDDWRHWAP